MRPLNLAKDTQPPMSKAERRAARKKRKREEKAAGGDGAAAVAAEVAAKPAAESTAVVPLTPSFSLDDDSLPDLASIPQLSSMQELKLVIMSATLSAQSFSEYFSGAPVLNVPGRTFPVDLLHAEEAQVDYLDASIISALQIHLDWAENYPGDILVFLTGSEEIETARKALEEKARRVKHEECPIGMHLCTLYANLPSEAQMAVFEPAPPNTRKVILATNIAETSLTIPGVRFVVDAGVTKLRLFNPRTGGEVLKARPHTGDTAQQPLVRGASTEEPTRAQRAPLRLHDPPVARQPHQGVGGAVHAPRAQLQR
jgi:hypothetical protein